MITCFCLSLILQYKVEPRQENHMKRYPDNRSNLKVYGLVQSTICYSANNLDCPRHYGTFQNSEGCAQTLSPHGTYGRFAACSPIFLSPKQLFSCHHSLGLADLTFSWCLWGWRHYATSLGNNSFRCGIWPYHTCSQHVQGKQLFSTRLHFALSPY